MKEPQATREEQEENKRRLTSKVADHLLDRSERRSYRAREMNQKLRGTLSIGGLMDCQFALLHAHTDIHAELHTDSLSPSLTLVSTYIGVLHHRHRMALCTACTRLRCTGTHLGKLGKLGGRHDVLHAQGFDEPLNSEKKEDNSRVRWNSRKYDLETCKATTRYSSSSSKDTGVSTTILHHRHMYMSVCVCTHVSKCIARA